MSIYYINILSVGQAPKGRNVKILTGIKNMTNPSPSEIERTTVFLLQEF